MNTVEQFLDEHHDLTRRYFLRLGAAGAAAVGFWPLVARGESPTPELAAAIEKLESYFTPPEKFRDVSRGKPLPHSLPDEKKTEVGLRATRGGWKSFRIRSTRRRFASR